MKRGRQSGDKSPPPRQWRQGIKRLLPVTAVVFAALLAYSNSFHAPLLMDNEQIILKDARVHAATSLQLERIVTRQYWPTVTNGLYRPLTTLSYLFNYAVLGNGGNPEGYHWLNFILHALNIVLVYALGLAIFDEVPAAVLLSALWGLHPVLTEAVTNVVGRADMLAACCVLVALLCHRQARRSRGPRKFAWLATVAFAATAGMFSKESAIVVFGAVVLYDAAFERDIKSKARLPAYAAVVLPCLVFLYVRSRVVAGVPFTATPFGDNPLVGADFWAARITAVKIVAKYVGLLLWPAHLSFDYSYNEIPLFGWSLSRWEDWKAVIAVALCLGAMVAAVRSYPRHRVVFFSIGFFLAALLPVSNLLIPIGTIMGERFLYLPSVGVAVLAVYVVLLLWRFSAGHVVYRKAVAAAIGIVLFALAGRTYARNRDWLEPERLWQSGIQAAPGSYKTHLHATQSTFSTANDWDRPVREADRTLAILDPLPDAQNVPSAYRYVGTLYRMLGEKVASGNIAGAAIAGTTADYWYRKSLEALLRSEKIELAGLTSIPASLYFELGSTYLRLADPRHAVTAFERGRALGPDPDLLEKMAFAYRATGDPRGAAVALTEALAMDSGRGGIVSSLVDLYLEIDPDGCSIRRDGGMPSVNVACPLVHSDICAAWKNVAGTYARSGQLVEAASIRRTAVQELGCAPAVVN